MSLNPNLTENENFIAHLAGLKASGLLRDIGIPPDRQLTVLREVVALMLAATCASARKVGQLGAETELRIITTRARQLLEQGIEP